MRNETRTERAKFERRLDEILREFPELESYRFELGDDPVGDPAAWIWFLVRDDAPDEFWQMWNRRRALRDAVQDRLSAISERWPFVHFRTVTEDEELRKAS